MKEKKNRKSINLTVFNKVFDVCWTYCYEQVRQLCRNPRTNYADTALYIRCSTALVHFLVYDRSNLARNFVLSCLDAAAFVAAAKEESTMVQTFDSTARYGHRYPKVVRFVDRFPKAVRFSVFPKFYRFDNAFPNDLKK